jgi:hypothetical protein
LERGLLVNRRAFRGSSIIIVGAITADITRGIEVDDETSMGADRSTTVLEILDPLLVEQGFFRKVRDWFREHEDSVLLVNLQPARFRGGPYVNFCVYYRRYGNVTRPKLTECQLYTRLESVVPTPDAVRVDELVDPDSKIPDDDRRAELQRLVLTYGLPWLDGLVKFDTARDVLARRTSKGVFVAPLARPDLDLPPNNT